MRNNEQGLILHYHEDNIHSRDAENLIRKAKISLILAFFSCILVAIPGIFNMINAVMDLKVSFFFLIIILILAQMVRI